jgi:RNA polymerase sigma-70 factor, ECF subfamily
MTVLRMPPMADAEPLTAATADHALMMGEEAFRTFYELTSRGLWAYLSRTSGDSRLADDLLHEAYYRLLRSNATFENDDHRRNYLYRIATNLVRDDRRRPRTEAASGAEMEQAPAADGAGGAEVRAAQRLDITRAMGQLKPRERSLLWLAYVQGCSYAEIAEVVGVRPSSLKSLLFRARRRFAAMLESGGRK